MLEAKKITAGQWIIKNMFQKNNLIKNLNVSDQRLLAKITSLDIKDFESLYFLHSYIVNCVLDFEHENQKHFRYLCTADYSLKGIVRSVIYRINYQVDEKIPIAEFVKSDPLAWENFTLNQGGFR